MPTLAFYLDAPMQSWGASSKYQYRETSAFPTKSAIVGLVAAALGIDKHLPEEADHLAPLSNLRLTAIRLPKHIAGRELDGTRLTDFHTVGGGYDKKASLREKMSIPQKASGAPFGTVITRRSYLTDTSFAVLLEGDAGLLEKVAAALLNPVWGLWFGRKTCLPATPLTPTLAERREEAFGKLLNILPSYEPAPMKQFEYQEEITPDTEAGDGDFFQSDQPISYRQHQGPIPTPYRARSIRHHRPE